MPFLTILTRSFRRPESLCRCVKSVAAQTDPDVEHVILHDAEGRGVGASYLNLRSIFPHGQYVYLLDDDNYLIEKCFVERLKTFIKSNDYPDVVYVDLNRLGTVLPDFADGLRRGYIDAACYVVKREVWLEHVNDFIDDYSADYYFIEKVVKCHNQHSVNHFYGVVTMMDRVSNGQPENIAVVA